MFEQLKNYTSTFIIVIATVNSIMFFFFLRNLGVSFGDLKVRPGRERGANPKTVTAVPSYRRRTRRRYVDKTTTYSRESRDTRSRRAGREYTTGTQWFREIETRRLSTLARERRRIDLARSRRSGR